MEMKLVPNLIKIVYVKLLHSSFNKAFMKITALIFRINYGIVIIAKIITYYRESLKQVTVTAVKLEKWAITFLKTLKSLDDFAE